MKKLLTALLALNVLISAAPETDAAGTEERNIQTGRYAFLPRGTIAVEPEQYLKSSTEDGALKRFIDIGLLRYGALNFSFMMEESAVFGRTEQKSRALKRIQYDMKYINAEYEGDRGVLSFFVDHRCLNYVNTTADDSVTERWYGIGLGWRTVKEGLRLSERALINASFAAGTALHRENYPSNAVLSLDLSGVFRIRPFLAPFIRLEGEIYTPGPAGMAGTAEGGLSILCGRTRLTPFIRMGFITDNDLFISDRRYVSTGLRFETSIAEDRENESHSSPREKIMPPEIGLTGSYAKHFSDEIRNYRSSIASRIDVLNFRNGSVFASIEMNHSSPKKNSGLYPRYIDYYHETGFSIHVLADIFIEPLYRYTEHSAGNTVDDDSYSVHLAGFRIQSKGMRPGGINSEARLYEGENFSFIFTPRAEGEMLFQNINGEDISAHMSLSADLIAFHNTISHLTIEAGQRTDSAREIAAERGIRVIKKVSPVIFYRYEKYYHRPADSSLSQSAHLGGIRCAF